MQLSVDPAAVLAGYRIGDSPFNLITPLNPYFAMDVRFAQMYEGIGTVVALILPYAVWLVIPRTPLFSGSC